MHDYEFCPKTTYISAFKVRFQEHQGNGDDTAMNGIKFLCVSPETDASQEITPTQGFWGTWSDWIKAPAG